MQSKRLQPRSNNAARVPLKISNHKTPCGDVHHLEQSWQAFTEAAKPNATSSRGNTCTNYCRPSQIGTECMTFHTSETLGNMVHLGCCVLLAQYCLSKALPVCYMTFTFYTEVAECIGVCRMSTWCLVHPLGSQFPGHVAGPVVLLALRWLGCCHHTLTWW